MRLFLGIALPAPVRQHLSLLAGGLPGARWTAPENLHLTLRFIGEVEGHVAEDLAAALDGLAAPALTLELAGVGVFEGGKRPAVLWAGVAPNPDLLRLQQKLERICVTAGLAPEGRKYHPHVTLARIRKGDPARMARFLADQALFRAGPVPVSEIVLYESLPGPVYRPLAEWRLG